MRKKKKNIKAVKGNLSHKPSFIFGLWGNVEGIIKLWALWRSRAAVPFIGQKI
jgi:hypothetical protein